jgi:NADPH-dependent ferric siderophore reductase
MPIPEVVPDWAVFLGDETTIGLAMACLEALPPSVSSSGAIELAAADAGALQSLGLPLHPVVRGGAHGDALLSWLSEWSLPAGEGVVWISGEAGSVMALRKALIARGVARSVMKIKPYWSTKGHAHRKELQRQM